MMSEHDIARLNADGSLPHCADWWVMIPMRAKWKAVGSIAPVLLLLFTRFSGQGAAQTVELPRIGQWLPSPSFGSAYAVAMSSNYAYVVGAGLHLLNISNPAKPVVVGA